MEPELQKDVRGFFARTWCQQEFAARGLNSRLVQCNTAYNRCWGTLRGMHFQAVPHEEAKLIRCTQGSLYDVIVDLRPDSSTHHQWQAFHLSEANRNALYVPEGMAHGLQTLEDDTEVFYQMSALFHPESARGFHHADPELGIEWPLEVTVISEKDRQLPSLVELESAQALPAGLLHSNSRMGV